MKERPNIAGVVQWAIFLFFLISAAGIAAFAGELRDYTLPSQKKYEVMIETLPSKPPAMTAPVQAAPSRQTEMRSVYDQFRAEVKSLSSRQRKELKETLKKKLGAGAPGEEKAYYGQLNAILDECGTK
jgi:biopolymer transport protein ExbB/TolQ